MADKLLICVSAEQASVVFSRNGKLGRCRVFRNDEPGRQEFDRVLAAVHNVPVHVMVDVVEEDYRFELLPHARGRDRNELLDRRLRQLYRNTPYSAAVLQGRDTGKRRDDQYLFLALINPELVENWLSQVRSHDLPVAGVYLLPVVAEPLIQKIAPATSNVLLVARHSAGLRLTFFRHGKLRISRLTRAEAADAASRASAFTEEIANTRLYLHAMRVMTLDENLTVVLLDRDGALAGLEQSVAREVSNAQATRIGAADIVARTGIPESIVADEPDALYLHYLGLQPHGNLAPEPVTERFQIYQMRRALYATAAIAGVASVAWAALNAYQIYDLRSQQALAISQAADFQRRYQEVTRLFPATPTNADNLVAAVQTAERLKTTKRTPEPAMIVVSRALEQFPNFRLKSFGWRYGARDFDSEVATRRADEPPAPPGAAGAALKRKQSAFIEAEIQPFSGDYRSALDTISRFAEVLRQDPAVAEVNIVALPLNVSPTMALSGSTTENVNRPTTAPFRVHVVLNPSV